ncbi:unnamed protein product [Rotaria sordida]|uniref:MACPF domain-containing protein n=1 Tax=Rotaria sordida TaxID=392033 RepID=A0A815M8Z5_9BILA|nr:unnamed protein product [Rotaria sordida]CAF1419753.1 unnamed protein product [Rotaria sordida]
MSSTLGGLAWAQDWFDSCLLRIRNTTWIREQVTRREPWGLFSSSSDTEQTTTIISEEWTKHAQYSLQLMGGNESIEISKWREWIPTVKQHPRPISYDLTPIYTLLPANSHQRTSLTEATLYFRTQADLNDRTYIAQLQSIPRPPQSRCQRPLAKRSLKSSIQQQPQVVNRTTSPFIFTEEARAALCPFVGTEGMKCFDDRPIRNSGRKLDSGHLKLPRGVGMTVDRSTGQIRALAVQLTYPSEGSRMWTDGHTGAMFNVFNEATLGAANRVVAGYDKARVRIFHDASQLDAAWKQTFADGKVRGGELARQPDMLGYFNK